MEPDEGAQPVRRRRMTRINRTARKSIVVHDRMQSNYRYELVAPVGRDFDPEFDPQLTPKEMLALGVFCGKYMTDCRNEFPKSWFINAKLSPGQRDCRLNHFGVDASQPRKRIDEEIEVFEKSQRHEIECYGHRHGAFAFGGALDP